MINEDLIQKDSRLLFLAYFLLKRASVKNPFAFRNSWDSEDMCNIMQSLRVSKYIVTDLCLKYGVIKEVSLGIFKEYGKKKPDTKLNYQYANPPSNKNALAFGVMSVRDVWSVDYSIDFDVKKGEEFVKDYLKDWENDKLFHYEKNLLSSENQISKIVKDLNDSLKKYPRTNLKFEGNYILHSEIDIVATLLYLESIEALMIKSFDMKEETVEGKFSWIFLLDVLDKFDELTEQNQPAKSNFKIDFDDKKSEVFVIGDRDRSWPIANKNDIKKENGKIAERMFKQRGKLCIGDKEHDSDNYRSLIKSLSIAFKESPDTVENCFIVKNGRYGLKNLKDL